MKPKIADLERLETRRSDRGWMATLDEHRFLWTCLPDLLRLARAAKEYSDAMLMANDEDDMDTKYHLEDHAEVLWDEMQKELDAFDWGDE